MELDIKRVGKVFGDRVLVKKLGQPAKRGSLFVPEHLLKKGQGQEVLWWAEVIKFGQDSKIGSPQFDESGVPTADPEIKEGDYVGIEKLGEHHATVTAEDGHDYVWVPEEFIAARDDGSVREAYERV